MCACTNETCWGGCPCGCNHTGPENVVYYRDRRGFVGGPNPGNVDASARRVLVVDPENRKQAERLQTALVAHTPRELRGGDRNVWDAQFLDGTQAALRSLIEPPKPPEPTGLGAVVEDTEGADWHRTRDGRWIAEDGLRSRAAGYAAIDVVRVLSEGVTDGGAA